MVVNKEISDKIFDIIVEALCLDDDNSVSLDSKLIQDLGAESIDFIDISFRIEKEFGFEKVNANNIFPFTYLEKELLDSSGNLIPDEVVNIKEKYPHINGEILDKIAETGEKAMLFSINTMYQYVELNSK